MLRYILLLEIGIIGFVKCFMKISIIFVSKSMDLILNDGALMEEKMNK